MMIPDWLLFLAFTLLAIVVQGLFAFFEMAAVSFNKIRLKYYVSIGKRRAIWLERLMKRPSRLFGTTLIGINTALLVGSECSRRFYESIHLDPDWSPITQVVIVVIFAELAPMFAARRSPEQIAMRLIPWMTLLSRLLAPVIWAFDTLSRIVYRIMGKSVSTPTSFSRDEVKMAFEAFEERDEGVDEWNTLVRQIFQLKSWTAEQVMTPIAKVAMASSSAILDEVRQMLTVQDQPFTPLYHRQQHNIIAVAHLRDLLRLQPSDPVLKGARSPWFMPREASILEILNQFRRNNQSVAVILEPSGQACGLLSLDQIMEQLFGEEAKQISHSAEELRLHIERTLSGEMRVAQFNEQFQAKISAGPDETLSDLLVRELGHPPSRGETVKVGIFAFTVLEPSLRGVKSLIVQTRPDF